jgi:Coenzyme PQQ synthesis protein D (PqqD)
LKDRIFLLSENMALESFDDGALVLNLSDVTFFEFNPTARDILKLLDGQHSLQQVAGSLTDEYEINLETALQDVIELTQELAEQGIITEVQPESGKEN